jgi:hypothetical protein
MIEPIEIDIQPFLQTIDLAIQYAYATVLIIVCAGAVYAFVALVSSSLSDED